MHLKRNLSFLLILILCLSTAAFSAQAGPSVQVSACFGYGGVITYLYPIPLRVELTNEGADADLVVAVNVTRSETEYDRYERRISLAHGAKTEVTLPVMVNYRQEVFTVEVLAGETLLNTCEVRPQQIVSPSTLLIGVLSATPEDLSYMNINAGNDTLLRGEVWQTVALKAEHFPENEQLLSALRILVVDGVDMTTLNAAQQEALEDWLRGGGIAIVGGGASAVAAYRGFSHLTGIMAAAPAPMRGVEKALYGHFAQTLFPMTTKSRPLSTTDRDTMLVEMRGAQGPVIIYDDKTLVDRCTVDAGVVYTMAFSLSERPLAQWNGMGELWQRMLLNEDRVRYQRIMDALNNYYDTGNHYVNESLLDTLMVENRSNALPALLAALLFILLGGIGSYAVLKKLDKREWMWLTVPLTAILSAVTMALISRGIHLNEPFSAAYSLVSVKQNGITESVMLAGVARSSRMAAAISAENKAVVSPGEDAMMGYYVEEIQLERPKRLRYCYTEGEHYSLSLAEHDRSWALQKVKILDGTTAELPITAEVWWEEDGLHGEIINRSEIALSEGYVLTDVGFCSVPALQPGERVQVALLSRERERTEDAPRFVDGELVDETQVFDYGVYSMINAALYPELNNPGAPMVQRTKEERNELRCRELLLDGCLGRWPSYGFFRYVTFSDTFGKVGLLLDGEPIERAAYRAVIDVEMRTRVHAESGLVRLTRGMIPAYNAIIASDGVPQNSGLSMANYAYLDLRDEPILCFDLSSTGSLEIARTQFDKVSLHFENYGAALPRICLYNYETASWQEVSYAAAPIVLSGKAFAPCLNAQGEVFVQFQSRTGNGGDLYNPVLTAEGRVQ